MECEVWINFFIVWFGYSTKQKYFHTHIYSKNVVYTNIKLLKSLVIVTEWSAACSSTIHKFAWLSQLFKKGYHRHKNFVLHSLFVFIFLRCIMDIGTSTSFVQYICLYLLTSYLSDFICFGFRNKVFLLLWMKKGLYRMRFFI